MKIIYDVGGWPHIDGWPDNGALWPLEPLSSVFMLHGRRVEGTLHHLSSKTAWVYYNGRLIKRHRDKHQVEWL